MHLLLFLHSKDRFLNAARINEIVFVVFSNSNSNFTKKLTIILFLNVELINARLFASIEMLRNRRLNSIIAESFRIIRI